MAQPGLLASTKWGKLIDKQVFEVGKYLSSLAYHYTTS